MHTVGTQSSEHHILGSFSEISIVTFLGTLILVVVVAVTW